MKIYCGMCGCVISTDLFANHMISKHSAFFYIKNDK